MPTLDAAFAERLASYLPEWQYDLEGQPQAALLFAAQQLLEDTRERMSRLPQKHEAEFLSALGMEESPAVPMAAYAAFSAPRGASLPAGSVFYLGGKGTRLWKTLSSTQAESMKLETQRLESSTRSREVILPLPSQEAPVHLFDFRSAPPQCPAVRFSHPYAFSSQGGSSIRLTLEEGEKELLAFLSDPNAVLWTLETPEKTLRLEPPRWEEQSLLLELPPAEGNVALCATLLPEVVPPTLPGTRVTVDCLRQERDYTCAICEEDVSAQGTFLPFGRDLGLWRCCYLACPDVLAMPGARITLQGSVDFLLLEEKLPGDQEPPEYRPIMRHLPAPPAPVQEVTLPWVAWEYWNGAFWLPLSEIQHMGSCFEDQGSIRPLNVSFLWPEDAVPCQVEGQSNYWLRWRITQSGGNGFLPRRLHLPQVEKLSFGAALVGAPVLISLYDGRDNTFLPWTEGSGTPFFPLPASLPDQWWMAFDRPPSGDTLSLFLNFSGKVEGSILSAWESTPAGLRPLALEDETEGLSHSGMVRLGGIAGQPTCRFGRQGWWLCLRDEGHLAQAKVFPALTGIYPGSVCLEAAGDDNAETGEIALPLHGGPVTGTILTHGFGGVPPERDGELLLRARQRQHHRERGISALDLEQLLRDHFRDVVRTRSKRTGSEIQVAVLLRDLHQHSLAFGRRRTAILQLLSESTALPTLGFSFTVRQPNFYQVSVTLWLRPVPGADSQTRQEAVRRAVEQFLHPVTGKFRGDGWWFGEMPHQQELRNYLRDRLPEVQPIKILLSARTPKGLTMDCSKVQDPFGLPVPERILVHTLEKEAILK